MAVEIAVIQGTSRTTTGTKSYESTGFGTPQAYLIFANSVDTSTNPQTDANFSVGMGDGTNEYAFSVWARDAQSTTSVGRNGTSGDSVLVDDYTGALATAEFSAWATDGVTLNWTVAPSTATYITIVLFKGLTNVVCDDLTMSTEPLNVNTLGFKPDLVFFAGMGRQFESSNSWNTLSFGAAHNNSSDVVSQGLISCSHVDNVSTSVVDTVTRDDSCCCQMIDNNMDWSREATDFDANGFSLEFVAGSTSLDKVGILAMEGADPDDFYVGVIDTPTSTGSQSYTGVGFQPAAVILAQTPTVTTNTIRAEGSMTIGAFDGTNDHAQGQSGEDGVGTTNNHSSASASYSGYLYDDGGSSLMHEATGSFTSDGFDLDFDTTDATARKWLAIAIKGEGAPADTYTLTADYGAFTLTGQAAALAFNRVLSADYGSFTPTGQDVTFTYTPVTGDTYTLTAEYGAFTLTGQDSILAFNRALIAEYGAFTLTGQDSILAFNRALIAEYGAFTLTGQDVTLTYTPVTPDDYSLVMDYGAFTLTGQDVLFPRGRVMECDYGSFSLTGQSATLRYSAEVWTDVDADASIWSDISPDSSTWTEV